MDRTGVDAPGAPRPEGMPDVPARSRDDLPGQPPRNPNRPGHREARAHPADQPITYPLDRAFVEPDWRRLPGYRDVTEQQWESAQWQRAHTAKNLKELKAALGDFLGDDLAGDIQRDMF